MLLLYVVMALMGLSGKEWSLICDGGVGAKLRLLNSLGYDYGLLLSLRWLVLHML